MKASKSIYYLYVALMALVFSSCGDAPVSTSTTLVLLSGNNQTAPARDTLPNDIIVTIQEATGSFEKDTGEILIEYLVTNGMGRLSKLSEIIRIPNTLGDRVKWALDTFGDQEMTVTATWVATGKALNGSPLTVKAKSKTIKDIDNNVYNTVRVGNQEWLLENLKTTKYNDGTSIPYVKEDIDWKSAGDNGNPAYCWYDHAETTWKPVYGGLYNFSVVETKKVCPIGYHVPTAVEFDTLINFAGGPMVATHTLKEAGLTHWVEINYSTNDYLFTALPGGLRLGDEINPGQFGNPPNYEAGFWSSTRSSPTSGTSYRLFFTGTLIRKDDTDSNAHMGNGYSIRCIKD